MTEYTRTFTDFNERNIEVFMGGEFHFSREISCLGHLRAALREILKELDGWGEDGQKCRVDINTQMGLIVDLEEGIPQ